MIVIAALPYVETPRALAAPAVLKAALLQSNIESVTLDLNHEIYTMVCASRHRELLTQALIYNDFSETIISDFARLVQYAAKRILSKKPTVITLSLFCFQCRIFCYWLCAELRQHTDCPIVIGGPGIDSVTLPKVARKCCKSLYKIWQAILQQLKMPNLINEPKTWYLKN